MGHIFASLVLENREYVFPLIPPFGDKMNIIEGKSNCIFKLSTSMFATLNACHKGMSIAYMKCLSQISFSKHTVTDCMS